MNCIKLLAYPHDSISWPQYLTVLLEYLVILSFRSLPPIAVFCRFLSSLSYTEATLKITAFFKAIIRIYSRYILLPLSYSSFSIRSGLGAFAKVLCRRSNMATDRTLHAVAASLSKKLHLLCSLRSR